MKGKYYIFNKASDFVHGSHENLIFEKNTGMTIEEDCRNGIFYSCIFDSLEKQTQWYKLDVKSVVPNNTTIRLTFFASDMPYIIDKNCDKIDIYSIIKNPDISAENKDLMFSECLTETFINPDKNIFRSLKGRYLWFKAELFTQQKNFPVITQIKAYIKEKNWIDYLPEIYKSESKSASFTERYLSLFQNLYEHMEIQIDNVDLLFNPDIADREFLEWLSSWLSISEVYMWNDSQLRYLMKNVVNMYKTFGTKESIMMMIKLYTGEEPVIIENCNLYSQPSYENTKKLYNKLYTSSPFVFTVLIRSECIKSDMHYEALLKIIESVKPAHMEVNLVVLQPLILLDGYSYMGINTTLSKLSSAKLDGNSSLDFTVI